MKLWYVKSVAPKPSDKRRSWFYYIDTVHAETEKAAREHVESLMREERRRKIVWVKECKSICVGTRIFNASDSDLRR